MGVGLEGRKHSMWRQRLHGNGFHTRRQSGFEGCAKRFGWRFGAQVDQQLSPRECAPQSARQFGIERRAHLIQPDYRSALHDADFLSNLPLSATEIRSHLEKLWFFSTKGPEKL
jgi:hypothetical protein